MSDSPDNRNDLDANLSRTGKVLGVVAVLKSY